MKVIFVSCCLWCPYHKQHNDMVYCINPELYIEASDSLAATTYVYSEPKLVGKTISAMTDKMNTIPEWCPLEEVI